MIATLSGTVTHVSDQKITLNWQGIGWEISVPSPASFQIESKITLELYMHWNQEQGPSLFGFSSIQEKTAFLLIIDCSGIGPKIGLSILQEMTPSTFFKAIQEEDYKTLSKVNGIGAKKAEHMVVHLKYKVAKLIEQGKITLDELSRGHWQELNQVLASLHYSRTEIQHALQFLQKDEGMKASPPPSFDVLLRKALSVLAKSI